MALYKPEKHKISDIIEWYIEMNIPSFDITQKTKHGKGYYHGEDMEEGTAQLERILTALKGDDNDNDYVLILNNDSGKSKSTIQYCLTFDFKGEFQHNKIGSMPVYNAGLTHSDIKAIAEEIRKQDVEDIDEEIEDLPEEQPSIIAGAINQLIESPEIRSAIAAAVINLPSVIGGMFKKTPVATSLAGICDDKNLDEVISILYSKGVKIEHLRKLAEMDQSKIQMLISML